MLRILAILFVCLSGIALAMPAWSSEQSLVPPQPSAAEQRLFSDAVDGTLDQHSLIAAALIAGGTYDSAAITHYEAVSSHLVDDFRRRASGKSAIRQARVMHDFLHEHVLRRYDADVTDLGRLFDDGAYNCVTATLLYVAIGQQCGLDITAVQLPAHVRCVLVAGGQELEFETTCPTWLPWPRHTESPAKPEPRRIGGPELVAMFYYNHAFTCHQQRQYGAAATANLAVLKLDPACRPAYENLLATLNNSALAEVEGRRSDVGCPKSEVYPTSDL